MFIPFQALSDAGTGIPKKVIWSAEFSENDL